MLIKIDNIPAEGLNVEATYSGQQFFQLLEDSEPRDFGLEKVDVACMIKREMQNVILQGTVTTNLELSCSRCLRHVEFPLATEFDYILMPEPAFGEEERELSSEDLDFIFYRDDMVDLSQIIVEQVVLKIPIRPLCSENCKGLCSVCGQDLNEGSCSHGKTGRSGPFGILKDVKIQKGT